MLTGLGERVRPIRAWLARFKRWAGGGPELPGKCIQRSRDLDAPSRLGATQALNAAISTRIYNASPRPLSPMLNEDRNLLIPQRKTARHHVADYLRQAILTGELQPGDKLAVGEVAARLGVSQTPAREALQLLAGEGLVRINEYRGADVAELSADEYEEIMLMRLPLEGLAACEGVAGITEDGIKQMRAKLKALADAAERGDLGEFVRIDRQFHQIHYLASGRRSLWERIINLRYAAERYTRLGYRFPGIGMKETVRSHRALLKAVEAGDGERAAAVMVADLNQTFESILAHLRAKEERERDVPGLVG